MKVPMSWLREFVALDDSVTTDDVAHKLTFAGLEVVGITRTGADVSGPVVIGRVADFVDEPQKNGKVVRWCQVDVGEHNPEGELARGIICGANNFQVGDYVVAALPGATLGGGFQIATRKTYGHISDGMLCALDELGMGSDHSGIIVLGNALDGRALVAGEDAAPVIMLREDILDIDLTPDLGYCQSIRGVAREAAQAFKTTLYDPVRSRMPRPHDDGPQVRVESDRCQVFVALGLAGVDPSALTPRHVVRRLEMSGMRSISLAVDLTNYVMLETGQPLHAYDADQLDGPIVVRQAVAGEALVTLDGVERQLHDDDLIIADNAGPLGLAGLMGGQRGEVTAETKNLVVEAAWFDSASVARSSRRHNLTTEASRRFERGADPGAAYAAAVRVIDMLTSAAGGVHGSSETVVGIVPTPISVNLSADLPRKVLGYDVPIEAIMDALHHGGTKVTAFGDLLTLNPPSWRPDLVDPNDFAEEIGRKIGLDNIPARLPVAPPGRGLTREQKLRRQAGYALAGAGLVEVATLPFMSAQHLDAMQLAESDARRQCIRLVNPLSEEQPFMRSTLIPGLMEAYAKNASRSIDDVAIFEIGRVFRQTAESAQTAAPLPAVDTRPTMEELEGFARSLPAQPRCVAGLLAGTWRQPGVDGPALQVNWQQAISAALTVGRVYGVELSRESAEQMPWHPGRCALLRARGAAVGYAGELHPLVCEELGLAPRTAAFEIDLDALLEAAPLDGEVKALSQHPVIKEDLALIVAKDTPAGELAQLLHQSAGPLCESVSLFDIYEGEQAGEGKKSLAFALRFRAMDRTLRQEDADAAKEAAVMAAAERYQAVQRA